MKLIIVLLSILSLNVYAYERAKHEKREQGSHEHGAGTLGIAFDGTKGKIDFKIPSESIFGFEYEAKTEKDKKTLSEALAKLETKISEMLVFDASLKCVITKEKIGMAIEEKSTHKVNKKGHKHKHSHSEHSDTTASYNVVCEKSPLGSELTFNFQQQFPRIKDLDVQVIIGDLQKSVEATKNNTKLLLK